MVFSGDNGKEGNIDMSKQRKDDLDHNFSVVTLMPGDVLYHPAGIWHAVNSDEDSIAINFSLFAMRTAEFVSKTI